MEIIQAAIEDAAEILSLQKLAFQSQVAIYQDNNLPPLTQTIEELEKEFETKLVLKAVGDGEIIGSVRALADGDTCHIDRLIVHPDHQGRGLGASLMINIEGRFAGIRRFELYTGMKSARNIHLYTKLGYKPYKELPASKSVTLIYMEKKAGTFPADAK